MQLINTSNQSNIQAFGIFKPCVQLLSSVTRKERYNLLSFNLWPFFFFFFFKRAPKHSPGLTHVTENESHKEAGKFRRSHLKGHFRHPIILKALRSSSPEFKPFTHPPELKGRGQKSSVLAHPQL